MRLREWMLRRAARGVIRIVVDILFQFLHDGNEAIYFSDCIEISSEEDLLSPVPFTSVRGIHLLDVLRDDAVTSLFLGHYVL